MAKKFRALATAGLVTAIVFVFGLAGCDKKSGEAIVIVKEHIDATEIRDTTSSEKVASNPEPTPGYEERSIGPGEISVGPYVMRSEDRGTSRDPRASNHEQWLVKVRLIEGGREFDVQADQPQWAKLKEGDRVKVTYRTGKYTGTVWASEIE